MCTKNGRCCEKEKKVAGQGGCEQRSEAFVKIQKTNWGGGVYSVRGIGLGGQGGCERRGEVFVKIPKKIGGGRVGGGGLGGHGWMWTEKCSICGN